MITVEHKKNLTEFFKAQGMKAGELNLSSALPLMKDNGRHPHIYGARVILACFARAVSYCYAEHVANYYETQMTIQEERDRFGSKDSTTVDVTAYYKEKFDLHMNR